MIKQILTITAGVGLADALFTDHQAKHEMMWDNSPSYRARLIAEANRPKKIGEGYALKAGFWFIVMPIVVFVVLANINDKLTPKTEAQRFHEFYINCVQKHGEDYGCVKY